MHELDFDDDKQLRHPIIQKHKELLQKLSDERVFSVFTREDNGFQLIECCDLWFGYDLNVKDCKELSKLFNEIAEEIEHSTRRQLESCNNKAVENFAIEDETRP